MKSRSSFPDRSVEFRRSMILSRRLSVSVMSQSSPHACACVAEGALFKELFKSSNIYRYEQLFKRYLRKVISESAILNHESPCLRRHLTNLTSSHVTTWSRFGGSSALLNFTIMLKRVDS